MLLHDDYDFIIYNEMVKRLQNNVDRSSNRDHTQINRTKQKKNHQKCNI